MNLSAPASTPRPSPAAASPRAWTVLLYSAADNNLRPYMEHDVAEMERVGSDDSTQLLVQIDHGRDGGGCQRLALQSDAALGGTPDAIDSPVERDLGQVNMASADTLASSLRWAMEAYPAEHFMLIISDHGNAWKGCCEDDSHLGWMDLRALKSALQTVTHETGRKLDVIGFDACMMANTEVAWQLKDQARYMVASEQSEGADGWPYTPILGGGRLEAVRERLQQRLDTTPEELARLIVAKAADTPDITHTMSAVDLGKLEPLQQALVELRTALLAPQVTQEQLREVLGQCEHFFGYRDLGHWLTLLAGDGPVADPAVKAAAERALGAYRDVVLAEQHNGEHPGASGLTIHLTKPNDMYTYLALDFQKDSDWVAVGNKTGPPLAR